MRKILRSLSAACVLAAAVAALATMPVSTATTRFYQDDPLAREPETQDASGVEPRDVDLFYDIVYNTFATPRRPRAGVRAANVNTIDEVPDSSWYTNRPIGRLSDAELLRGANTLAPGRIGLQGLTVIRPKTSGAAPGFVVRCANDETWFLAFDPPSNPEGATGAVMVASRIFWALGYYQAEQYLADIRPDEMRIAETAMVETPSGRTRPMTRDDVNAVLRRAARNADGSYRAVASRLLPGRVVGHFKYEGTRNDDPNDIVPHEHRRELRALKVFGAWTNLVDIKTNNTLDTVVQENGRAVVRHYLQDVGSTFGIGANGPRDHDEGWEHIYDGDALLRRMLTLGLYLRPWQTSTKFADLPAIGRFEGDVFEPEAWRPRVPVPALREAREDDTFWAARRVAAFTDEMIRAVVKAGHFSDPAAERYLAEVLIKRRDRIAYIYLPKVNPVVDFALDASGVLSFSNAAVDAGVAGAPKGYRVDWAAYDNATRRERPIAQGVTAVSTRVQAPAALPATDGAFVKLAVTAVDPEHASWTRPVHVYFKRVGDSWKLVGIDRMPS